MFYSIEPLKKRSQGQTNFIETKSFFLFSDQHRCNRHDGKEEGLENLPPSHDQSFVLGSGQLRNILKVFNVKCSGGW